MTYRLYADGNFIDEGTFEELAKVVEIIKHRFEDKEIRTVREG
jgi:hypothetical protein